MTAFGLIASNVSVSSALAADAPPAKAKPAKADSSLRIRPKEAKLTGSVKPAKVKPGDKLTFSVEAKLEPGWHIYKYDKVPFGTGPRNTTFDLFDTGGLETKGGWKASKEPFSKPEPAFANQVLEFFEDEVTWSITLVVPKDAKPGKRAIRCQAGYQICDPNSCKIPGQWTLPDVEVTVEPGDEGAAVPTASDAAGAVASASNPPAFANAAGPTSNPPAFAGPEPAAASPVAATPAMPTTPAVSVAAPASPEKVEAPSLADVAPAATPAIPASPATASATQAEASPTAPAVAAPEAGRETTAAVTSKAGSEAAVAAASSAPSSELEEHAEKGFLSFLLFSALGGLYALAMPCVWPMVPITVNFFVKQGQKNKGKTTGLAIAYCLSIIGVFTAFGVFVSFFFSSKALQTLANNPWLNAGVAFLFLAFGLSLLGLFEIRLPNFLLNASARGESRGGMVGVMFMALTLTITSFTCTFPVVGTLVVMASKGQFFYPIVGLATFSAVMALPFFVLALAPGLLAKMPKSGDWMNSVKVVGGLVEIGAALKFINTAEIGFGAVPEDAWFDAPLVLSIWVALAAVCGVYLLGLFRTDHDHDEVKIGPGRLLAGSFFIGLALFFLPALFGHPPKSPLWNMVVGIFPADVGDFEIKTQAVAVQGAAAEGGEQVATSSDPETAEREQKNLHGVLWGMSFEAARERSKSEGRPVLIDFTGVNCMNCRTMEEGVMRRPEVVKLLSQFVTVQLYTDFVPIKSITPDQRFALAEKNQDRILELAQEATNPFYVVLGPEGQVLKRRGGLIPAGEFVTFLEDALKRYSQAKSQPEGKVALASPPRWTVVQPLEGTSGDDADKSEAAPRTRE